MKCMLNENILNIYIFNLIFSLWLQRKQTTTLLWFSLSPNSHKPPPATTELRHQRITWLKPNPPNPMSSWMQRWKRLQREPRQMQMTRNRDRNRVWQIIFHWYLLALLLLIFWFGMFFVCFLLSFSKEKAKIYYFLQIKQKFIKRLL